MNKEISRQADNLKFCQDLAMDILKMLNDEQLDFTLGKNMGTLGEQFRQYGKSSSAILGSVGDQKSFAN